MLTGANAVIVSAYAEVVTAIAAAIAVLYGIYQIRLMSAGNRREEAGLRTGAETIWRQYELLCIQHPDFACPEISEISISEQTFGGDVHRFLSYEYFVSFLLYACEQIHSVYSDQADWMTTIADEIEWHSDYLKSSYFEDYLSTCAESIREMIEQMKQPGWKRRHQMPGASSSGDSFVAPSL